MKLKTFIFFALFSFFTSTALAEPSIICSMYPVYDFTRQITGTLANVKLLIRPGVEPHDYEPTPRDVKALNDADMFVFTGKVMETWAEEISHSLNSTKTVDASHGITLTDNDPHIWLDLSLAQKMTLNILEGLCEIDPDNSDSYRSNAQTFNKKLQALDEMFNALRKDKALVFAGEFSAGYFVRRYGFSYVSAYDGENEPSVKQMAQILKYIREHKIHYIFADTGGISQVTRSISTQTGAKILTFGTGHNVPDLSMTFIDIMNDNYRNISEALND